MRKILVTTALFIFIINSMLSQGYTPMPENVAVWDIYHEEQIPDIRYREYDRYIMKGDTIINAINYNKIYCVSYNYTLQGSSFLLTMGKQAFCFGIRQDVPNKKVYRTLTTANTTIDTLLYDYDLQIGDTVPTTFTSPDRKQTVTATDSVTFRGKKYRRFMLKTNGMSGATLIEGVGNANGFIEQHIGFFEGGDVLSDFCNSDYNNCSGPLALKVEESNHPALQVNIYPNPFTDETTLSFSTEQPKRRAILYNVLGMELQSYNCSGIELLIQKEELKNGVYFLKIINGNNAVTQKLVVQ
jgi:hypothetical protein